MESRTLEVYPRYILNVCAEKYDQLLFGPEPKPVDLNTYLEETYIGRKEFFSKENTQIIDEGMEEEQVRRLLQCVIDHHNDPPIIQIKDCRNIPMKKKPWDFEFKRSNGDLYAVEICESGNNSLYARKLGRIIEEWKTQRMASVYWIRRQCNPIKLGEKGQERIKYLKEHNGFVLTDWPEEEWNSIAALIWLLNEADGGNLLLGYDAIPMERVENWIASSGVLEKLPVMNALLTQKIRKENGPTPINDSKRILDSLESIVAKHRIIVFDKACDLIRENLQPDSVNRDQCLKALGASDRIESSAMQNTQILYWLG